MYCIIGERYEYMVKEPIFEEVATFDNKEDAEKYLEKSKLKNIPRNVRHCESRFRTKSLLSRYHDAYVEEFQASSPPSHNPEIKW